MKRFLHYFNFDLQNAAVTKAIKKLESDKSCRCGQ